MSSPHSTVGRNLRDEGLGLISKIKRDRSTTNGKLSRSSKAKTQDAIPVAALLDMKALVDLHGRENLQRALEVLGKLG